MPYSDEINPVASSNENWQRPQLENASTQIRLLRFLPDTEYSDLRVELEVFELSEAPAFNAVSYTWGIEPPQDVIRINGAPVTIRPNCHYALGQCHHHFPTSPVWLDAICINQDDLVEKGSQGAIMGHIYAAATRVLACIGPADICSDAVRHALTEVEKIIQDLPDE